MKIYLFSAILKKKRFIAQYLTGFGYPHILDEYEAQGSTTRKCIFN
jgi:hypothetical protein